MRFNKVLFCFVIYLRGVISFLSPLSPCRRLPHPLPADRLRRRDPHLLPGDRPGAVHEGRQHQRVEHRPAV